MLADLLPASMMDAPAGDTGRELDRLVAELSTDLINDIPTADPRWAEATRQGQLLYLPLSACGRRTKEFKRNTNVTIKYTPTQYGWTQLCALSRLLMMMNILNLGLWWWFQFEIVMIFTLMGLWASLCTFQSFVHQLFWVTSYQAWELAADPQISAGKEKCPPPKIKRSAQIRM